MLTQLHIMLQQIANDTALMQALQTFQAKPDATSQDTVGHVGMFVHVVAVHVAAKLRFWKDAQAFGQWLGIYAVVVGVGTSDFEAFRWDCKSITV